MVNQTKKLIRINPRVTEKNQKFIKRFSAKAGIAEGEVVRIALDQMEATVSSKGK